MGVTHGANAVSGIVNIITKKNSIHKVELSATVQEESVGDEYEPFSGQGRHIQALRGNYTVNDNWFVSLGGNRNDFGGYLGDRGGRDYTNYDINDPEHNRGYSWLPKMQYFGNAMVRYQRQNTRVFYKFEYFNEDIDYYNPVVGDEIRPGVGILKYSDDRRYNTQKFYHHLNGVGKVFTLDYNVSLSYQKQQRDVELFKYYIQLGEEANNKNVTYQETEVIYSTGTLSNFFKNKKVDLQVGYEAVNTNGYSSSLTGSFSDDNQGTNDLKKRLENYDVFSAAEISLTESFSIRPGFRYSFQSKFEDQWAASFGLRQLLSHGFEARASYGRSYRTPNYDELYTYFVDANHNVQGNPDLVPETSNSVEASLKKNTFFDSGLQLTNNFSVAYMNVDDRIEQAIVATTPSLQYKYININTYKMWNMEFTNQFTYQNWQGRLGASLVGISRNIDTGQVQSDDKFLYNVQLNASASYTLPKWNTVFSAYYKFNGKQQMYMQNASITDPAFELQEIESFGLLDASIKQSFFKNRLDATIGGRNLLNVVNIQSSIAAGATAHTAGSTNILMGYGRSYFLKLTYNLNF
jgi:outer membrane receptor for ferrienterochelin and colicins